ncbi:hypothetical protein H5410_050927 [Solanum commersonii]|uniref:DUF4283 domain-containing protein n=1 Tax=Solanum commersonii TaxID=4109 RepID=A0A9J5WZ13_SOLCO|nr:hypothetical protein H5410_050927 [Solanum commersonii]
MSIEDQIIRIQAWTPEFRPEEETRIVPIWVALPELPWHCYNKVLLSTLLEPIGKVLYLDSPTFQRTRGSIAREQPYKGIAGDSTSKGKSDHEVQSIEGSRDDSPTESNHTTTTVLRDHAKDNCYNKTSGIDSSLPIPHSPNVIYVNAENFDEVCGGMDGGCQEKPTNLQEGVTKGGSFTHFLHENVQENVKKNHKVQIVDTGQVQHNPEEHIDQRTEVQSIGTGQIKNNTDTSGKGTTGNLQDQNEAQMKTPNNKSQGKMSKNKRNTIKRRQEAEVVRQGLNEGSTHKSHPQGQTHESANNDEYNVVPSEDEFDQDTLSLGDNNNEEDETSIHLIKPFGSTLHQEELQEITDQQGLSPRGRLKSKQANNNTSANSSRPNTRSRSRGF